MRAFDRLMEGYVARYPVHCKPVLEGLRKVFARTQDILFHPSSGSDIDPILYFNRHWTSGLRHDGPELIIKCDGLLHESVLCRGMDIDCLSSASFHLVGENPKKPSLFIGSLRVMEREVWVMEFYNRYNEDILRILVEESVPIRYLYSHRDGIMSGMGIGYLFSIGGLYYSYLYPEMGVEYHISEFIDADRKPDKYYDEQYLKNLSVFAGRLRDRKMAARIRARLGESYRHPEGYEVLKFDRHAGSENDPMGWPSYLGMYRKMAG